MTDASRDGSAPTVRTAVLLGLLTLVVVGPFVQIVTAQPASRYALTDALVEEQTVRLDDYAGVLQVDRAEVDGHLYSDKPPAQSFLAVPVHAAGRALGVEPGTIPRERENLGVWWVTLWSATIPAAVLAVVTYLVAARHHPRTAAPAAFSLSFATLLLPFASELYGHLLAGALVFGAWALIADGGQGWRRTVPAGLLLGTALAVEYQVALVAIALAAVLVSRRALTDLVVLAVAALPGPLALAWYQQAAFGSPVAFPYDNKPHLTQSSDVAVGWPSPRTLVEALVGGRGVAIFTPVVMVGAVAAVAMIRRRVGRDQQEHAWLALGTLAAFLLLMATRQTDWPNPLGGEMPGPRYLIPALPFLAVPVAWAWEHWRPATAITTGVGVVTMAFPLVTLHLVPQGGAVVASHLDNIREFGFTPTVLTLAVGPLGWIAHLVAIAVVAVALWRSAQREAAAGISAPAAVR